MALYQNYIAMLARLQINHRLRGKLSPSDIVQETFLTARQRFAQFRGNCEEELIAWLRKILATRIADFVRHYSAERRDIALEQELDAELDGSAQVLAQGLRAKTSSPSQHAMHREQGVLLADALAQLPPDYREVIIRRNLEQQSFAEVALGMDRSMNSVRNLWTRAIAKLRLSLGELE
jgi:RNA polymerase sigma-70 factor (ECF subfamily)